MWDNFLEGATEEVLGTISGLPPGTLTLASTLVGSVSGETSGSESSAVEKHTEETTDEEELVLKVATAKLASTCHRDHPRATKRQCAKYAIDTLRAANRMYSTEGMNRLFRDALSRSHRRRRRVMMEVSRDFKKAKRLNRL